MPLYEYQCQSCAHRFEIIQKFSDAPISSCPKCGSSVQKLFSSPAIQFKGSGWYITDYARKNGGESTTKSDKSEKGSSESTPAASSDSSAAKSSSTESSSSGTSTPGTTSSN